MVFSSWNVSARGPPRPAPHFIMETKAYKEKVTGPESDYKIRSPVLAHYEMSPQLTFWVFPACAFVFIFLVDTFLALRW